LQGGANRARGENGQVAAICKLEDLEIANFGFVDANLIVQDFFLRFGYVSRSGCNLDKVNGQPNQPSHSQLTAYLWPGFQWNLFQVLHVCHDPLFLNALLLLLIAIAFGNSV
jgi:hypothetical protein